MYFSTLVVKEIKKKDSWHLNTSVTSHLHVHTEPNYSRDRGASYGNLDGCCNINIRALLVQQMKH